MYYSACIPALFRGASPQEALTTVAACSIPAFELWGWWDQPTDEFALAQRQTGLRCAAMCTRMIPLNDPAQRDAYVAGLRESIAVASRFGCRTLITQVGQEIPGVPRAAQHQSIVDGLRACVKILTEAGVTLVVEPLNTLVNHPGYYLSGSAEGFDIIREVDSPSVRLLYDVYHQQITEGNLLANITSNIDLIGHVHVAGVPGRHEPLTNCEIDYRVILAKLRELGYQGAVGLEYHPLLDVSTGLRAIAAL